VTNNKEAYNHRKASKSTNSRKLTGIGH